MYSLGSKIPQMPDFGRTALRTARNAAITYLAAVGTIFVGSALIVRHSAHPSSCWLGSVETNQLMLFASIAAALLLILRVGFDRRLEHMGGAAMIIALSLLAGCAGPQAGGSYQTSASYDRLYTASLRAVSAVGYTVVSSNKQDGLIVASQGVIMGSGSAVGLSAQVINDAGHRVLQVSFTAPPGTFALGNFYSNLTAYVKNVRASVPDLTTRF